MIFGDSLNPAESAGPAEWITESLRGRNGAVGGLIPNLYECTLRLHSPDPVHHDWWDRYSDLFGLVASVGARYTSTPALAWFAIWEGHGFDTSGSHTAWKEPPANNAERLRRAEHRAVQSVASTERNTRISSGLAAVPLFDVPNRTHYLTYGSLSAVTELRYPAINGWRNPDLFWPDDRSWFAATDVDFWSLYIGGSQAFTSELETSSPTPCEYVDNEDELPIDH